MYRVVAEGLNENGERARTERLVSALLVEGFRSEMSEREKIIELAFKEDVDFFTHSEALGLVKITITKETQKEQV